MGRCIFLSKEEDMKEQLIQEFENDRLYHLIKIKNLEDYLFTEEILSMHTDITYSTIEAGQILGKPDSTIRNHFRSDLIEYIAPERLGKYYRLNYKSIFRLHMIFLLIEKASQTTVALLSELGLQPTVVIDDRSRSELSNSGKSVPTNAINLEEILVSMNKLMKEQAEAQANVMNILKYENKITKITAEIEFNKLKIEKIRSEYKQKYLEERQEKLLIYQAKNPKKKSLLGLFKNKNDLKEMENQFIQIKKKYEEYEKDDVNIKEYTTLIESLEDELKNLQKEKEQLETKDMNTKEIETKD